MGDHVQQGIVACCHIDEYVDNTILKHEKTRRDKEDDRTRHVVSLNANTGPVFLTFRDRDEIDLLVKAAEKEEPLFDITAPDGIKHTIWKISDVTDLQSVRGQMLFQAALPTSKSLANQLF